MLGEITEHGTFYRAHESLSWELDRRAPWPEVVAVAREAALIEAACNPPEGKIIALVEWIAEPDR
ncbi:MAG: hypothetical protein HOV79_03600 [Hamadaea sp.]|nr:hypothetical protein [Hamadaea sp.]